MRIFYHMLGIAVATCAVADLLVQIGSGISCVSIPQLLSPRFVADALALAIVAASYYD